MMEGMWIGLVNEVLRGWECAAGGNGAGKQWDQKRYDFDAVIKQEYVGGQCAYRQIFLRILSNGE